MTDPQATPEPTPAEASAEPSITMPDFDAVRSAELAAEVADLKDKLLRTLAEMENLRRRTEREVKDAKDYAVTSFARDLLSVADNFERALGVVPAGFEDLDGAKGFVEGIAMTGRELATVMEKHGIRKVDPAGQKFDPNRHQAMFEVPNPDVVAGTVVQVLQPGFVIGERVLRPALVGVAKGGPKAAPAAEPPPAEHVGVDRTV